ncbi:hypothetical protein ACTXT7_012064 [Hymenolepis weldensis]
MTLGINSLSIEEESYKKTFQNRLRLVDKLPKLISEGVHKTLFELMGGAHNPANKSYRMEAKISASPPAPIYLERGHAVVGGHLFSPFPQKRVLGDSLMQESSILLPCDRDAQIGSPAIRKVKDVESNPTLTVSQYAPVINLIRR